MAMNNAEKFALAVREDQALPATHRREFDEETMAIIRQMVGAGAPEPAFNAFIAVARACNLDPLTKQIYLANLGGANNPKWTTLISIDGYRSIAEQSGAYAGSDPAEFTFDHPQPKVVNGKVLPRTASVTVYRQVRGAIRGFTATVWFDEYNKGSGNWATMPKSMLAKVAETQALRKAFPSSLNGTTTAEEAGRDAEDLAVETTGTVTEIRPPAAGDVVTGKELHDLYKAASLVGIQKGQVLRFAAFVSDLPEAELPALTTWSSGQAAELKANIEANGADWIAEGAPVD